MLSNQSFKAVIDIKMIPNPYFYQPDSHPAHYDAHELFQYYNFALFNGLLQNCVVRWTTKMTLCAGTCKYEGFGSSTISLSQPLLKFRSSNELKQTLIHEMIHAYLFQTNLKEAARGDGHGPAFQAQMLRINSITGLNITIYHSFKDEVNYYRQHVWRCNGRCRQKPPFYGYVKRAMNRKPQPADHWWQRHERECGGQFIKMSEPQKTKKTSKNKKKLKEVPEGDDYRSWGCGKSLAEYFEEMKKEQRQTQAGRGEETKQAESRQIQKRQQIKGKEMKRKGQSKQKRERPNRSSSQGKTLEDYFNEIRLSKEKEKKKKDDSNEGKQ